MEKYFLSTAHQQITQNKIILTLVNTAIRSIAERTFAPFGKSPKSAVRHKN